MRRSLILIVVAYLTLSGAVAWWVYQTTFRGELAALETQGLARLSEATNRLRLQVDSFRALANYVAGQPDIVQAVTEGQADRITADLSDFALTYGAWQIDLLDPAGHLLTTSQARGARDIPSDALLRAALNGRLGFSQAVVDGRRMIRLSRLVQNSQSSIQAVVIVTIDLEALEFEWPVTPEPVVFFDAQDRVFSSNRSGLLLLRRGDKTAAPHLDLSLTGQAGRFSLWRFAAPVQPTQEVMILQQFVPHLKLSGAILLDTGAARATAELRLLLELALALVLGLIGYVIYQGNRRLALEARHSSDLEMRVQKRTQELQEAQDELVEASKLAALGRLSAGVSHELNQPLGAILNYARNGQKLLGKGRVDTADENFEQISAQIDRITRIITNLRAFARQDVADTEEVDFVDIVEGSLRLMADEIEAADVRLSVSVPPTPVLVMAGRVRLEQVLVNLISNALDAMADAPDKVLDVSLALSKGTGTLVVKDTGPGIAEPDRVFEPFYTTKDLGASMGLGMGLSLSFGIISRFGGHLTCRNHAEGAAFQIELPIVGDMDA